MMLNVEQRFRFTLHPFGHDNSVFNTFTRLVLINKLIVSVCCVTTAWCGVLTCCFYGNGSDRATGTNGCSHWPTGYHWDTSDWMPSVQLPGIQEFPQYEVVETPAPLYSDPSAIDTDYYPGGFDIESDFPPPPEDFPASEDLPPPPLPEYGDTLRPRGRNVEPAASPDGSPGIRQRPALPQLYSLNKYLPQHSFASQEGLEASAASALGSAGYRGGFPLGCSRDFDSSALDNMSMSLYTSTASCSDMSACCEESEVMISDYESGDEGQFERLVIPGLDSQQHTEV